MLAAVCAWQQNGALPTRTKALYIDGVDFLLAPGTPGNKVGIPIETIELVEAGMGQSSSLRGTIEDPAGTVSLAEGGFVTFMDLTLNLPLFMGFLQSWTPTPFGIGRRIEFDCIGVEAVLDWAYVPASTFGTGWGVSQLSMVGQAVASVASGLAIPLRIGTDNLGSKATFPTFLNDATPIFKTYAFAGGSLRDALTAALDLFTTDDRTTYWLTVDFYGGLRVISLLDGIPTNVDYVANLSISSATSVRRPVDTEHRSTLAPHQVYVIGGNAAGTGVVTDGTGLKGPTPTLSDNAILDRTVRDQAGRGYLRRQAALAGSVGLDDMNAGSAGFEVRTGGGISLTDSPIGLSAYKAIITEIRKVFSPSGAETWRLTYGRTPPSGANLIRRLTRQSLST